MNVLIIGAGLSGCALARILSDQGHDIQIIEKRSYVGGLCITRKNEDGLKYEPFGARTFHSKNQEVIGFVNRFDNFNGYTHRKGLIINNELFPFPLTVNSLSRFDNWEQIQWELDNRPGRIDDTNFETACISIFGPTLYSLFIENYTRTMWGLDPTSLTSEWAPKRLELRTDDNEELFRGQWQGLPVHGYSHLLDKMVENISISFDTTQIPNDSFDVIACSAPIDSILNYRFGRLPYRSMRFQYQYDHHWEHASYGTVNLPQDPQFIRKCNFKILHKQESSVNWIQYQEPVQSGINDMPMYPINTRYNDSLFEKYLLQVCNTTNILPFGRLGLYKYLDMDKAIELAFEVEKIIEDYPSLRPEEKLLTLMQIRSRF